MSRKHKTDLFKCTVSMGDMYKYGKYKKDIARQKYYDFLKSYYEKVRKEVTGGYEYSFRGRWGGISIFKYKPQYEKHPFTLSIPRQIIGILSIIPDGETGIIKLFFKIIYLHLIRLSITW